MHDPKLYSTACPSCFSTNIEVEEPPTEEEGREKIFERCRDCKRQYILHVRPILTRSIDTEGWPRR